MANKETVMNRWIVVIGAIAIQLCLGAIYAWSVFTPKLADPAGTYAFTVKQTQWVFSLGLLTFASVMIIAGRLQGKITPRMMASLGGIILGIGYILGGFFGNTFAAQMICIGFLGGAGIGLAFMLGYHEKRRERLYHKLLAGGCAVLTFVILIGAAAFSVYYRLLG